jgi:hypothetical protein
MTTNYLGVSEEMHLLYRGNLNLIERAEKGELKRTEAWVVRQKAILAALTIVGKDLNIIAANAASFEVWKAAQS